MNLTEQELKAIEMDAVDKIPAYPIYMDELSALSWAGYIKHLRRSFTDGATQERIKAKKLLEALEKINELPQTIGHAYQMQDISQKAIAEYNKNS